MERRVGTIPKGKLASPTTATRSDLVPQVHPGRDRMFQEDTAADRSAIAVHDSRIRGPLHFQADPMKHVTLGHVALVVVSSSDVIEKFKMVVFRYRAGQGQSVWHKGTRAAGLVVL